MLWGVWLAPLTPKAAQLEKCDPPASECKKGKTPRMGVSL